MSVLKEKLQSTDDFWDIQAQERRVIKQMDTEANGLRSAIALTEKIAPLRNSPGWDAFVRSVEDCRTYRRLELELCSGPDSDLRVLQGRVRELGAILSLMKENQANAEVLANRLRTLEAERQAFVREDGKVVSKGVFL